MMKSQVKMKQLQDLWMKGEVLQEERSNIWKRCVNRWESTSETKTDQNTRNDTPYLWRVQKHQETYLASNQRRKECSFQKLQMKTGDTFTSKKGIANVFGEFCGNLFADDGIEGKPHNTFEPWNFYRRRWEKERREETKDILVILDEEIQTAMNNFKQRKARQQWNPSRRHQDLWWCDERNGKTALQGSVFQSNPETWRRIR